MWNNRGITLCSPHIFKPLCHQYAVFWNQSGVDGDSETWDWVRLNDFNVKSIDREEQDDWLCDVYVCIGESSEDAETYHALLGEQVDSQASRQDLCALPSLCWRWEDWWGKDVPRHGHGFTWQESRGPLSRVQEKIWSQNCPSNRCSNGKWICN